MKAEYRLQATNGGDYTPRRPLGAIDISIGDRKQEIFIDNYVGQGANYKQRDEPLINLFDESICIFAGTPTELFKPFQKPLSKTSEEIAEELNGLIDRAMKVIYTPEFQKTEDFYTEETRYKALGILISKFCKWDLSNIETVCREAFEDSNADPIIEY